MAILAGIDVVETYVFVLVYKSTDTPSEVLVGGLIVAGLIVYPFLLVGAAIYLTVLWRRVRRKRLPTTRARAVLLSPLVALPLALLLGIAGGEGIFPWMAAGAIAYGLLVRLPPSPAV